MGGFKRDYTLLGDEIRLCKRNHRVTKQNLYYSGGKRRCRKCQLKHTEEYRLKGDYPLIASKQMVL